MVREILEGGTAVDAVARALVVGRKSGGGECPFVEAVIVIIHVAGAVCHRVADGVGVASLVRAVERTHQPEREPRTGFPFQADASGTGFRIVRFLVGIEVGEVSVTVSVIARDGIPEFLADFIVMGEGIVAITIGPVGKPQVCPFIFQRRFGVDVDDAAHRVAPVECSLRTAQHFYPVYFGKVEIECRFLEVGDSVDVEADRRRVDLRTDPADVDGRRQFRSVIGHEEVRDEGTELFDPRNVTVLYGCTRNGCGREGFEPEVALLLEGLNDDLVQFHVPYLRRVFLYFFSFCRIGEKEENREEI